MKRTTLVALCVLALSAGLALDASAGTLLVSDSVFEASKKEQVHPAEISAGVFIPERLGNAKLCVYYTNTTKKGNQGQIRTDVTILHKNGDVETLKLNGKVRNNEAALCKKAPVLKPGDGVAFEIRFENMPRLRKRKSRSEMAHIAGVVTAGIDLDDLLPDPEPAPECPKPDPDPNPGPDPDPGPNPSGGLSEADQRAASSLLIQSRPSQLWREKGGVRGKWTVVGPATLTQAGGPGGLNQGTAGYGSTIAAAVADYERKRGKLPAGGLLSARDRQALEWYSKMNASGGPTSVRRDSGGTYHGEYYRPGRGTVHRGGFGSIADAVDFLKSQGL